MKVKCTFQTKFVYLFMSICLGAVGCWGTWDWCKTTHVNEFNWNAHLHCYRLRCWHLCIIAWECYLWLFQQFCLAAPSICTMLYYIVQKNPYRYLPNHGMFSSIMLEVNTSMKWQCKHLLLYKNADTISRYAGAATQRSLEAAWKLINVVLINKCKQAMICNLCHVPFKMAMYLWTPQFEPFSTRWLPFMLKVKCTFQT